MPPHMSSSPPVHNLEAPLIQGVTHPPIGEQGLEVVYLDRNDGVEPVATHAFKMEVPPTEQYHNVLYYDGVEMSRRAFPQLPPWSTVGARARCSAKWGQSGKLNQPLYTS